LRTVHVRGAGGRVGGRAQAAGLELLWGADMLVADARDAWVPLLLQHGRTHTMPPYVLVGGGAPFSGCPVGDPVVRRRREAAANATTDTVDGAAAAAAAGAREAQLALLISNRTYHGRLVAPKEPTAYYSQYARISAELRAQRVALTDFDRVAAMHILTMDRAFARLREANGSAGVRPAHCRVACSLVPPRRRGRSALFMPWPITSPPAGQ